MLGMTTHRRAPQPPPDIEEVAAAAIADPRTVQRRLLGLPVRGRVADRVDSELARRGYAPVCANPNPARRA